MGTCYRVTNIGKNCFLVSSCSEHLRYCFETACTHKPPQHLAVCLVGEWIKIWGYKEVPLHLSVLAYVHTSREPLFRVVCTIMWMHLLHMSWLELFFKTRFTTLTGNKTSGADFVCFTNAIKRPFYCCFLSVETHTSLSAARLKRTQ